MFVRSSVRPFVRSVQTCLELSIFIILAQASFMSFFLGFLRSHSLNSLTLLDGQTEPKILRLVIGMRNEC